MPSSRFVHNLPKKPTFSQKGFSGFHFPIESKSAEAFIVESSKGHDNFVINKRSAHFYYVLEGEGIFEIASEKFPVSDGVLVEIPPSVEFTYTGKMRLLVFMVPPFSKEAEVVSRKNLLY